MSSEARKPTRPQTPSVPLGPQTQPPRTSTADELRGRIAKRLAFAGALIAVLLGALAVFDYLARPAKEENEAPTFNSPVPVSPPAAKPATQPVTPTELAAPASVQAATAPAPATAAQVPEQPPPPVVAAAPSTPAAASASGEPTKMAAPAKPVAPSTAPTIPAAQPLAPTASATPAHQGPTSSAAPRVSNNAPVAVAPAAVAPRVAPSPVAEAAVRPAATLPRLLSGYSLQAGVFSSTQRAEEVHAMLMLNGIPSSLETRVQVGPFATRAEADDARQKLKALGIDALLLLPDKRR
jgi:DedD protein